MRIIKHSIKKILFMLGGRAVLLPAILLALLVCFAAFGSAMSAKISPYCRIAAVDGSGGELSSRLLSELEGEEGFLVLPCESEYEAKKLLLDSEAEAMLVIKEGYDEALISGDASGLIAVTTVPGSVSSELIRETLAGKLIAQRTNVSARSALASEGFDAALLDGYINEFDAPTLYSVRSVKGRASDSSVFGQGFPGYEGFAALGLMLVMLTLAHRLSSHEARLVASRMGVIKHGALLDSASDGLSVLSLCVLISCAAFAFAPEKSVLLAVSLLAYSVFITGLIMLIVRHVRSVRMDMASCFIALVTSILGGCFADFSSLSPVLSVISRLTPQGQMTAALHGAPIFIFVLIAEGCIFALLSLIQRKRDS